MWHNCELITTLEYFIIASYTPGYRIMEHVQVLQDSLCYLLNPHKTLHNKKA